MKPAYSRPTEPANPTNPGWESRFSVALFLCCLGLHLWLSAGGWGNVLLDTHGFRQTQTALVAQEILRHGFQLDYAMPVLGAPWSVPFEFPLYQAATAAVAHATGWPLESAGRGVTLVFFYATLPAIWLLLRRLGVAAGQAWIFLALVVTCPVYLFFSRTFLIESTAFWAGAWFLYCFQVALEPRRRAALGGAAVFGILAGLTKVTTFAIFLIPAAVLLARCVLEAPGEIRRLLARAAGAALPGLALAAWWVTYTDGIKRLNPFGADMTAAALRPWVFGTSTQRLTLTWWEGMGAQLERAVLPGGSLLVLVVIGLLIFRGRWRGFLILAAVAAAGPLIFANLYFVHDYYWYASGVFILAFAARPLACLFQQTSLPLAIRLGLVLLILATQLAGYRHSYYDLQTAKAPEAPELTRAIALATQPDAVLLGFGLNWDPAIPYYSGRRALFIPDANLADTSRIEQGLANVGRIAAVIIYRNTPGGIAQFNPWLERLDMDPTPLFATGEYHVHLRKDLLPAALQSVGTMKFKEVFLYQGRTAQAPGKVGAVYWVDQLTDRKILANLHPQPIKITSPFPLTGGKLGDRRTVSAHATTELEFPVPVGAQKITAEFGIYPGAWSLTDGVEFEIVAVSSNGIAQQLYHRWLQPAALASDRGVQSLSIELLTPVTGKLLFRTLPGPAQNDAYDWAYWGEINIR